MDEALLDALMVKTDALERRMDAMVRRDAELGPDEHWITMNGSHVLIEGHGPEAKIKGGAGDKFKGKALKEVGSSALREHHETKAAYHAGRGEDHEAASKKHTEAAEDYAKGGYDKELTEKSKVANEAGWKAEPSSKEAKPASPMLSGEEYNAMTPDEHDAIYRWRSETGFKRINRQLVKGDENETIDKAAKFIAKLIDEHRLAEPMKLYRGAPMSDAELSDVEAAFKSGKPIKIAKGFAAATPTKDVAEEFSTAYEKKSVVFEIGAPAGTHTVNINSASDSREEDADDHSRDEFLFAHNAEFDVKSVDHVKRSEHGADLSYTRVVVVPKG
jgi:hypothetical protein